MKFSLEFVKEFIEIKVSAEKLASLLTMAGLEVIAQEKRGSDTSFEVEVTSNRPDLFNEGVANKEIQALLRESEVSEHGSHKGD